MSRNVGAELIAKLERFFQVMNSICSGLCTQWTPAQSKRPFLCVSFGLISAANCLPISDADISEWVARSFIVYRARPSLRPPPESL